VIDRHPQDFPRIDERRSGRPYRYAYTMMLPETADPAFLGADSLFKHDLQTGVRSVHSFGAAALSGRVCLCARAYADAAEDEGWLIGLVVNAADETTDLVILDAHAISRARPAASIHIPHRIPPGFHGNWLPQ
jgi:carotenoid cleavage dioxygenase-like enzyme